MQIGDIIQFYNDFESDDSLNYQIGIVRAITDDKDIRVSSFEDPCSADFDINNPHWSIWLFSRECWNIKEILTKEGFLKNLDEVGLELDFENVFKLTVKTIMEGR